MTFETLLEQYNNLLVKHTELANQPRICIGKELEVYGSIESIIEVQNLYLNAYGTTRETKDVTSSLYRELEKTRTELAIAEAKAEAYEKILKNSYVANTKETEATTAKIIKLQKALDKAAELIYELNFYVPQPMKASVHEAGNEFAKLAVPF